MKARTKINFIIGSVLLAVAGLLCVVVGFMSKYMTASAASIATKQILKGTEITLHDYQSQSLDVSSKRSSYSESVAINTNIQFYTSTNNGMSSTTNNIRLNKNEIIISFMNADFLYHPDNAINYQDTKYAFSISDEFGQIVWNASYLGMLTSNNGKVSYLKTVNINGDVTEAISDDTELLRFCPSDLGVCNLHLEDGRYSINITRTYIWGNDIQSGEWSATSELTGTLVIDTSKLSIMLNGMSSGNIVEDGAYVKEKVIVTVGGANFDRLYYKTPTNNSFLSIKSNSYISEEFNGCFQFYAEDKYGVQTEIVYFYYDDIAPTGAVYSNGIMIEPNGAVCDSFYYRALDSGSGVSRLYYKTPQSEGFEPYAVGLIISGLAGDGWYYFYAVDLVGNESEVTAVYLATHDPYIDIYRNGDVAYSREISSSTKLDTELYFNFGDTFKIICTTMMSDVECNYPLNSNVYITENEFSNKVYSICIKISLEIIAQFDIHVVKEMPKLVIDGTAYGSGATLYFNERKTLAWTYDTGRNGSNIRIRASGAETLDATVDFSSGTTEYQINTSDRTETNYSIAITDAAGNVSDYSVIIDKLPPDGKFVTAGNDLPSGGYTNKPLQFIFSESGVTATYSQNGGEYRNYTSGQTLTADGTYTVILTDRAKNKSTYTAHIDTVPPVGQMYANYLPVNSGAITNGRVYFTWDGNLAATVNGRAYSKNTVLSADSDYVFVLTDYAGNSSRYTITIDTVAPKFNAEKLNDSQQLISKWHIVNFNDTDYSFATYDEALAFANGKEYGKYVTALVLDRLEDFNQHHLVANGSEVRTGEYWLYKSKTNPDSLLYYFDREILDEVIGYYAKNYVSGVKYLELDGENIYGTAAGSMSDNLFTASNGERVPVLNGFIFDMVDGSELFAELVGGSGTKINIAYDIAFDKQISTGGLYKLTEFDEAGNETVFYGFLDVLAPELKVSATIYGNENATELNITKNGLTGIAAYYYEAFNVNAISDADKWAVLSIKSNSKTEYYTYGDKLPCLTEGGEYLLSVYDRLGNGYSFTVFIVGNPAKITMQNNADDTAFDLTIALEQKFDTLVLLEIRRNGILLDGISTSVLTYTFDRAGTYTLTLRDNFGRTIAREYVFNKALPYGELSGVENGGKTKSDVTFLFDSEKFYAIVTKDGQAYATEYSGELFVGATDPNSGHYAIRLIRIGDDENFTDYSFVINTFAPEFSLSIPDGAITNKNVTVTWSASDIVKVTYCLNGGEAADLKNGAVLSDEGSYIVVTTNDLGTQSVKTFTIDKTLDYYLEIGMQAAQNIEVTNETIAVFNNEPLNITAMKNGTNYEYAFGQVISDEGIYTFRVSDEYGNTATFSVTIDKSVAYSANVGNGLISNGNVQIENGEKLSLTVTKDGQMIEYEFGQILDDEGVYKVIMKDACGNEKSFEFQIVKGVKQAIDYTLGESVTVLSIERNGESVGVGGNHLVFTVDGIYTVTAQSEGVVYSFELTLDSTPPTIDLIGVKNGGVSGKSVIISNLSEQATVIVFKDGELIEYELGNELSAYGEYRVLVTDEAGNQSEYAFTLKHVLNGGAVALIVIGILLAGAAVVGIVFGKRAVYRKQNARKTIEEQAEETTESEALTEEETSDNEIQES